MNNEQNLITGRVSGTLTKFAPPLLAASLLQPFYGIVDMLVIGNVVGETGLVAISNASMISFIINSIRIGVTMGGTVLAAQYKGAGDEKGQREATRTLFSIAFITSIIVTVLGLLLYGPVFQALGVPAAFMEDVRDYIRIICGGTVFVFGYNVVCSILKGYGDSKTPSYFIVAAAVINIVLDMLLVGPFGMGTKGVAYATIFSQGISSLTSILYLRGKGTLFDFQWKYLRIHRDKLVMILKVGLPSAVQMAIVNISCLLIAGMLNRFGVSIAAAPGIGLRVNTFTGMPCWVIRQAAIAIAGQNMGVGNLRRVKETVKAGLRLNILVVLAAVFFVQILAGSIITLFEPGSPEVFTGGTLHLRMCCGVNSLAYAVMYTLDSLAIGTGSANTAMVNVLPDAIIVRPPLGFLLAFVASIGFAGIYIGQVASPVLLAIVGPLYSKSDIWERKSLIH